MALVVPSRFSSLKIVEDDFVPKANKEKKPEPKKPEEKKKPSKNGKTSKNAANHQTKKKFHPINHVQDVQETKTIISDNGDEFEQALLLSKLEMEEKTDVPQALEEQHDFEPFQVQLNKKNKKNKQLFQPFPVNELKISPEKKLSLNMPSQSCSPPAKESPSMDELLGSHLVGVVEQKSLEITSLKAENDCLKKELAKVKDRNRKLCSIIGQGEMKEKGELIAEIEKQREVQTELTNEVASLHIQLEQLKSSSAKMECKNKDKRYNKKK